MERYVLHSLYRCKTSGQINIPLYGTRLPGAPSRSHHFKRKVCADEKSRKAPYHVHWLGV
jgi:hypothetical protein